jgi:Penicillin amidase
VTPATPERGAHDRLRQLGAGATIDETSRADGIDRAEFDAWWAAECARRLPALDGPVVLPVSAPVTILRDERGLPHIFATNDHDLFVAYGFAQAQDRLFQMDLRRRRAGGRLGEVLGEDGLADDVLARTMDFPRLAAAEHNRLPAETRALYGAFADGVNAAAEAASDAPAIEFDLLGYAPEPWTSLDSILCVVSWRWRLTGRPQAVSAAEFAKRILDDPRYAAFLASQRELDDESVVPAGASTARDVPFLDPRALLSAGDASGGSAAAVGPVSGTPGAHPSALPRAVTTGWSRAHAVGRASRSLRGTRIGPTRPSRCRTKSTCRAARSMWPAPG